MGVTIRNMYYNTILKKCKFILVYHDNSVALVDVNNWEGLTDFISIKNRHKITKLEWNQICNGCPEYFYSKVPNDIEFKTPLDDLTAVELHSFIEELLVTVNLLLSKTNNPLDKARSVQKILDLANIKQSTEMVNYVCR